MAKHRVLVHQPEKHVMNTDVRFEVWADGKKFGELGISKGGITWRPGNARKRHDRSWEKLDTWIASDS